jgi:hypothetical protein
MVSFSGSMNGGFCVLTCYRKFSGDESFIANSGEAPDLDAGSGLGVTIEGKKKGIPLSQSRL